MSPRLSKNNELRSRLDADLIALATDVGTFTEAGQPSVTVLMRQIAWAYEVAPERVVEIMKLLYELAVPLEDEYWDEVYAIRNANHPYPPKQTEKTR